jgi:uncharacterized protein
MNKIEIRKPTNNEIETAKTWPIWEKGISKFDYSYNSDEKCYILEGKADIIIDNKTHSFKKGDFVIFHKGLECVWIIREKIKKHYNFG